MRSGDSSDDEAPTYRLCEDDDTVCDCWLPGAENPDPEGPLDQGGFESFDDAKAFKLGIDRERALFRLIPESVEAIDRERESLDLVQGRPRGSVVEYRSLVVARPITFWC